MAKVSLRAYNREIETMIDRGQFDEAIAHCRHIFKTYPKHLETYRLLGKAYLESKRYAEAVDIFSRILTTMPNDFVAQVGMSIIRDEQNNLDDAIWHMERAFETQPSNPAIQAELQRLYGRRDGVKPPRIRMTRGALANMYVQGELYPQAISEIKNVLKDDPERADMQALLARALYRNGVKNEAADVASALLRRYPYSLDANRVLVEILGSDHPETTQVYRQRVFELDPYAAHVTASLFLANEVSDAAVNIERLDWNGQPVAMPPDWKDSRAISLEGEGDQSGWLSEPSNFGGIQSGTTSIFGAPPEEQPSAFGGIQSAPAPIFGSTPSPEQPPAEPAEEIPDFLRAAGWGTATGAFDESKSSFGAEEEQPAGSIEQGDLPDWIKAMKPAETEASAQKEEELPDWIKTIGMGAIASRAFDEQEPSTQVPESAAEESTQWLSSLEGQPEAAPEEQPSSDFSWLKNLDETEAAPAASQPEDLDWMQNLGTPAESAPATSEDQPDWLRDLGEPQAASTEAGEDLDWLKNLGASEEAAPSMEQTEASGWPGGLGDTQAAPAPSETDDLDWIRNLGTSQETAAFQSDEEPDWLKGLGEPESMPSSTREDQPDWLKGLAVSAGIESLSHLTQDEQPAEEAEVPAASAPSGGEADFLSQLSEEPILQTPAESKPAGTDLEHLGTTQQEQDDSFAWLESLAAKQGATEGLLTKPDERLEEEPEWVKQAKGLKEETTASLPPADQQPASLEELGKSEQEQDDSFAWLESLAAKQGATEGLLTKPEERLEEEPEWVKQAKDLGTQPAPPAAAPVAPPEEPVVAPQPTPQAEVTQPTPMDEVEAWLNDLEGEKLTFEPESEGDETGIWMRVLDQKAATPAEEPVEAAGDADLPDWMKNIQEAPEEKSTSTFAEEAELGSTWMPPTEEPEPVSEPKAEETLPSWLRELDREEEPVAAPTNAEDLPAWLLADETAPGIPEPTIFSDWKPVEEAREAPAPQPPVTEEPPEAEIPAVSLEMPEAETVLEPEQPQIQTEPEPVVETPVTTPAPQPEPVLSREPHAPVIPTVDPLLAMARNELSRNNVQGALDSYGKLIKKARFLDEVIYDLRDALYRYPVDVNLWQSLGDAYMRANRLQDALDAYTKAEELLR